MITQSTEFYDMHMQLLKSLGIAYREFTHEPVFDYENFGQIHKKLNLNGVRSAGLFLKCNDSDYYMLITLHGKPANFDRLEELLSAKPQVASLEEFQRVTGYLAIHGAVFVLPRKIPFIVDKQIFSERTIVYSPGLPEKTIQIETSQIIKILDNIPNKIIFTE